MIVFLISYALIKHSIDSSFENYIRSDTKDKFYMIEHDFSGIHINKKKLYAIYSLIYKQTFLRITLIKPNGKVIFDSSIPFTTIDKLENHKYRPEIQKVFKNGSGFSKRFSKTKKMYMLYYAKVLPNGNILRISYPLTHMKDIKNGFEKGLYTIFLLTFLMIIIISALIARKLSFPIQKLNYIVEAIKTGKNIHFPRFKDENLSKAAGLIYNIYKAMEEKQKEIKLEKEKLDNILEFIEEGVLLLTNDLRYVHSNAKFKDMFGIKAIEGESILSNIKDHELLAVFSDILNIKITQNVKIKNRNFKMHSKQIDDYILFIFEDIEEKIQYEYFKSELVGNISHELKTPIAALSGYAETLMINENLDIETQKEFVRKIYENAVRLNNILNDIIELHRLENSTKEIYGKTDIKVIKTEIEELYKNAKKNIYFTSDISSIKMIKEHIMSILTNLIDNAIKYSTGKNVYVNIKRKDARIVIAVDDEGPAIDEKDKDRIFERFYTHSKSRNKQKSGTGLGLSIVKHISALYGGSINLRKNASGGNSFVISIPI